MSIEQAATKGVKAYQSALNRRQEATEAYIKGLDYIIDNVFNGDVLGTKTLSAIEQYEHAIGA